MGRFPFGACENARGEVLFSIDRYQGSAAPYPDLVVFRAKLEINDRVKGYIEKKANGNFRVNNWPNDVDFVERTKRVNSRTGDRERGRETYVVLLVVKSAASGKSILRKRGTCESSWDYLRP